MKTGLATVLLVAAVFANLAAEVTLTDIHGRDATVELIEANSKAIKFRMNGAPGKLAMEELEPGSREKAVAEAKSAGHLRQPSSAEGSTGRGNQTS